MSQRTPIGGSVGPGAGALPGGDRGWAPHAHAPPHPLRPRPARSVYVLGRRGAGVWGCPRSSALHRVSRQGQGLCEDLGLRNGWGAPAVRAPSLMERAGGE